MEETFKRRNYFIDKGSQGRFMAAFTLASMAGGGIAVFGFRYFAQKKIDATIYSMKLPDIPLRSLLMDEMLITSLLAALFVIILFVLVASRLFARLSGPLQKMSSSLRRIAGGDLQSGVRLREDDEFREFGEEVNALVEEMRARLTVIRHENSAIRELCRNGASALEIKPHIEAMRREMEVFTL